LRRLLLPLLLAAIIAMTIPATSQAANSTCTTHSLAITGWGVADDHIDHSGHFQCGGANIEDYFVELDLQFLNGSGVWQVPACPNGYTGLCISFKPATGWYPAGADRSWTGTFNLSGQIDCKSWRMHARVNFRNGSPDLTYNSLTYTIGGVGC
jgi:hypothetical protein